MNYYISIQYARKNPDGTIPDGFDMEFDDSEFVGKRVTYPRYSDQIPKGRLKLQSSQESFSPFRKNHRMATDIYEITEKTYDSMEDKPPLSDIEDSDGKRKKGWVEKDHQDQYSEIRKYIIKGL